MDDYHSYILRGREDAGFWEKRYQSTLCRISILEIELFHNQRMVEKLAAMVCREARKKNFETLRRMEYELSSYSGTCDVVLDALRGLYQERNVCEKMLAVDDA